MKIFLTALVSFVLGTIVAASIQSLLVAGEASKNKRSLAEARNILDAVQRYRLQNGNYPSLAGGLREAEPLLVPTFAKHLSEKDVYDRPYIVFIDRTGPVVVSTGRNGFAVRSSKMELPADRSLGQ